MNGITPRGIEVDLTAARPMDARGVACDLLHTTRVLSLATLDPNGYPYSTVTNFALDASRAPIFFAAGLSLHARNMAGDPRISITVADHDSDVMTTPRLSLSGEVEIVEGGEKELLAGIYLNHFPKAKLYLALPDAHIYRLRVNAVQLNGGPAQNANKIGPADLAIDVSAAAELIAALPQLVDELNAGKRPARIAAALGASGERWKILAIDPEGIDLASPEQRLRYWFNRPVHSQAELSTHLTSL